MNNISDKELLQQIIEHEKTCNEIGKIGSLAYIDYICDMNNHEKVKKYQEACEFVAKESAKLTEFVLEIAKLDEKRLKLPIFEHYWPFLRDCLRGKPHQLTAELETAFKQKSITGTSAWSRFFDEFTTSLKFNINGKQVDIGEATHNSTHKDEAVRKTSLEEVGKVLGKNIKTFTFITNTLSKDKQIEDEYRKFPNPISSRNFDNFIEDDIVLNLIDTVKENYPNISHRYYKIKAKLLGKEKLKYWDRNAPLPFSSDAKYEYEEAKEVVLEAYKSFSPQAAEIGELFFKNNWIDPFPRDGKDTGAFSHPVVPSEHPFILMNFYGTDRCVATLAHELGHGIHQYLAKKQGALMCSTPLTLAETASVFGEKLTFESIFAKEKNKQNKICLLASKLDDAMNTIVRQIAFCNFELLVHNERKNGELSSDQICNFWMQTQQEALGEGVELFGDYKNFWSYIPHFIHSPFYVYSYAFGECLVNSLYKIYTHKTVKDFEQKYIEMLTAGGTKHHKELLEPFSIDISQKTFWQGGIDVIIEMINTLESLI